jgi:hypothetical protein
VILPQLLAWRVRLATASLRGRGGRRRALQLLVSAWVAAMFLIGATVWFRNALGDPALEPYAAAAVFGALHAAFLLSLVRDMGAAIGHLFQAPDVPLLLSAPVRPRPLVLLRAGEALADAGSFPAPLLAPILWGYGIALGAPWIYYVAVPLVMAGLLCFSVLLGFLVSLYLAPRVPVGRARSWIRGTTALLYLAIWIGLTWWNVVGARRLETMAGGLGRAAQAWSAGGPAAWIPSAWAARLLLNLAAGNSIVLPLGLLGAGGAVLAALLAAVAPRYPECWQRAQELAQKAMGAARRAPARLAAATGAISWRGTGARATADPAAGAALGLVLLRRDRRLITRDAGLLWDIALLVFMSSVLPILAAPVLAGRIAHLVLFALVFFSAELGFDLSSRALPLERRALPWILEAPISPGAHIAARLTSAWLMGWPIVAVVAVLATWASGLGARAVAFHLVIGSLVFSALVPIGLACGVFFGQPEWRHPRQMLNLGGRLVLAGILVALGVVLALAFAGGDPGFSRADSVAALALPLVALALLADLILLWMSATRLRHFQWLS